MEFFPRQPAGIIKIDRNVETVNSKSNLSPPPSTLGIHVSPDTAKPWATIPEPSGRQRKLVHFRQEQKDTGIIPVKCIVPCKHIFGGEWPLCSRFEDYFRLATDLPDEATNINLEEKRRIINKFNNCKIDFSRNL